MASSDSSSEKGPNSCLLEPDRKVLSQLSPELTQYLEQLVLEFVPTEDVLADRRVVQNKINRAVSEALGSGLSTELFGSCACGIAHKSSDLDLIIMTKDCNLSQLRKLSKVLRRTRFGGTVRNVFNARIPIIQFKDDFTKIEVDIKLGKINGESQPIHRLKSRLVKCIVNADDRIRKLILLVKKWAKARLINDASQGTLNSFGYTFLVIYFLQQLPKPIAPVLDCVNYEQWFDEPTMYENFGEPNKMGISELLVSFFDFYQQFSFDELAVCVRKKQLVDNSSIKTHEKQRRFMIIQDPFDEKDNVARNIKEQTLEAMQKEFARGYEMLIESYEKLFEAAIPVVTKNQLILRYVRTQKKAGVSKSEFDMKAARKELGVSPKRIQKALDRVYGKKKKISNPKVDSAKIQRNAEKRKDVAEDGTSRGGRNQRARRGRGRGRGDDSTRGSRNNRRPPRFINSRRNGATTRGRTKRIAAERTENQ